MSTTKTETEQDVTEDVTVNEEVQGNNTDFPIFSSGDNRPYWAYVLTDFCIAVKVAVDADEEVPQDVRDFASATWPWVLDSNNEAFVSRKIEWHSGDVPGRQDETGRPKWIQGYIKRERLTF